MFWLRRTRRPSSVHTGVEWGQSTICSQSSASGTSIAKPKLLEVGRDGSVKLGGLGLLLAQLRRQSFHLHVKRFVVVLHCFGADVATGRQHMTVLLNLF